MIWNDIILDGHNRFAICQKHNIPFKILKKDLPNRNAAMVWIIRHQLNQRNLRNYERVKLGEVLEPLVAAQGKERQREGGRHKVVQHVAQPPKTREVVAQAIGLSHETIRRVKVIEQEAPEEVKKKLREGKTSIRAAYTELRAKQAAPKPVDRVPAFDGPPISPSLGELQRNRELPGAVPFRGSYPDHAPSSWPFQVAGRK